MIRRLVSLAAAIGWAILVFAPDSAWAEKRVALVIGNSTYQTVPQLPNPSRDANAVAKLFQDAGFESVDVQLNVGNLEFKRAIRRFETLADQADIAVVYYAGHGLEISGNNYLIPTDARLASDRDADDEAILLERLVSSADGARRLRLVILDACRDNPFVTTMRKERKVANRAVTAGLGKVEPTSTDTLIAYAAKAGSTADDGDGQHSPFTAALLKNLTVPGLDVRLAFGRVRDDVLKSTGNRQEPFVYGSLGGGNISLVPAPAVPQEAAANDIKTDYELVDRVGTTRAWQVFLGTHPNGFYADLARAQIERLGSQPPPQPAPANPVLASLPPAKPPPGREAPSKEAIEWDKIRESTDPAELQKFIRRFPDSPLSINAQQRMESLKRAAQEREEKARAEREAAQKAAEDTRLEAERKKAELAVAKKREDDERRAREAEAEQKAKAAEAERKAAEARQKAEEAARTKAAAEEARIQAEQKKAELAATKKREDGERRAREAEAEKAKAAEAERKAAEAKQKTEDAAKTKAATEEARIQADQKKAELAAAKKREDDERRAKATEAQQQAQAAEAERKAAEAKQKAEEADKAKAAAEAAAQRAASEKQAREAEAERKKAEAAAAQEATCKSEQARLDELTARGSEGSGRDDLKSFSQTVSCARLGPLVVATLDKFNVEAARRAAAMPNSPELVRRAQTELVRLGCLTGKIDGNLGTPTRSALGHYMSIEGQPSDDVSVTGDLVTELTKHTTRVCPIECKSGESLKGETCVANEKPAAPASASRDDEDVRRKLSGHQAEREPARRPKPEPEAPRARQQAVARPSIVSGGGGGSHTMIGVGF